MISSLTRFRRDVELLINVINERAKWVDIEKKLASYQLVWRDFVDIPDKYMNLSVNWPLMFTKCKCINQLTLKLW